MRSGKDNDDMTIPTRIEQLQRFNDAFEKHLDQCSQCNQPPFKLCHVGHVMLNAAGGNRVFDKEAEKLIETTT